MRQGSIGLPALLALVAAFVFLLGAQATPLLRFPTASETALAFVAHGDLWTAPLVGGAAWQLTHGAGDVSVPNSPPAAAGSPSPGGRVG